MFTLARVTVAVVLIGVAGFCVFGFLASYEPPGSPTFGVVYGALGLLCLAGVVRVQFRRSAAEPSAAPDWRGM
jgi:hypothetical protein